MNKGIYKEERVVCSKTNTLVSAAHINIFYNYSLRLLLKEQVKPQRLSTKQSNTQFAQVRISN